MSEPRAKTSEDLCGDFLAHLQHLTLLWSRDCDRTDFPTEQERMEGLVHSILVVLDGMTDTLPEVDMLLRPHPDDKSSHQAEGEDWIEDGTPLWPGGEMLHDRWGRMMRKAIGGGE